MVRSGFAVDGLLTLFGIGAGAAVTALTQTGMLHGLLLYGGGGLMAVSGVLLIYLFARDWFQARRNSVTDDKAKPSGAVIIGTDSVVLGIVPPGTNVGARSVLMGATDNNGNAIYTTPMTIGYAARGDSTSIVVGAHAAGGAAQRPHTPDPSKRTRD